MSPHRYQVGDKVVVTEENLWRMESSNRSCVTPNYPSGSYLRDIRKIVNVIGEVTHVFPPGYEVTAKFGELSFHLKDNWITPVAE